MRKTVEAETVTIQSEGRPPETIKMCALSVGISEYPRHAKSRDALVAAADKALYRAKKAGRNRVECDPPRQVEREAESPPR